MRKAFNFYRSYYDVAKELSKKDREEFLMAILRKQFEGIEPTLEGMVNFAYLSQKHSIDSQVKGYEDKTKQKLLPIEEPIIGGSVGGSEGGSVQEKEKEKVEYTKKDIFLNNWINYRKEIKKKLSEASINNLRKIIADKSDECVEYVIQESITNGWQGLFWDNYKLKPLVNKSVDDLYAENVMRQMEENQRRNDTTGRA
jgi:hypothetical protein